MRHKQRETFYIFEMKINLKHVWTCLIFFTWNRILHTLHFLSKTCTSKRSFLVRRLDFCIPLVERNKIKVKGSQIHTIPTDLCAELTFLGLLHKQGKLSNAAKINFNYSEWNKKWDKGRHVRLEPPITNLEIGNSFSLFPILTIFNYQGIQLVQACLVQAKLAIVFTYFFLLLFFLLFFYSFCFSPNPVTENLFLPIFWHN